MVRQQHLCPQRLAGLIEILKPPAHPAAEHTLAHQQRRRVGTVSHLCASLRKVMGVDCSQSVFRYRRYRAAISAPAVASCRVRHSPPMAKSILAQRPLPDYLRPAVAVDFNPLASCCEVPFWTAPLVHGTPVVFAARRPRTQAQMSLSHLTLDGPVPKCSRSATPDRVE
jgi:hypothetical protein